MRSPLLLLLAVSALSPALALGDEALPRPEALEPNVRFWERVYSEVDGTGGLIHDAEHLDVVYEVVRFREDQSRRSRDRQVKKAKARVRDALEVLRRGRRSGLSAQQAEVLSRWPEGVSNATLRRAASNVRFQLGQADRFREGLIRSGAWLDHIQHTLRDHGVPVELSALPHVESSFNPKAYSRVGAAGLWQFTRSTGHLFLRIDSVVDERFDPWKASEAAARLLAKNREITGTWPLAITAYNHGAAGMKRAANVLGTTDIATIVREYKSRTFGFASRNFYASFLAAVDVDRNARELFGPIAADPRVEYTLIEMPSFYRATSLSAALGVDMETLREHNGALRPAVWQGNKYVPRGYQLRVPSSALRSEPELLLAAIPAHERLSEQHRDRFHKVRRGETLSRIARRYGVSQSELVALNNLRSRHRIRVGQVLTLPGGVAPPIDVARQDPPADGIYTVRRGDNLSIISRRFGVSVAALAQQNGLRNKNQLHVGQQLEIPGAVPVVLASAEPVRLPAPAPERMADALGSEAEALATSGTGSASEPAPDAEPDPEPEPEALLALEPEPEAGSQPQPEDLTEAEPEEEEASETGPEDVSAVEAVIVYEPEPEVAPEPEPEPEPGAEAEAEADEVEAEVEVAAVTPEPRLEMPPVPGAAHPDPSDYSVHDGRVTVQAAETLGHYADWLEIRASQLRARNHMRYGQPLQIGRSVRLDFSRVTPEEFERRRLEYHRTLQSEFFSAYEVTGTETHVLRRGESLWYLAERKYRVPIWLLRQYNPDLDFSSLPAGVAMVVPVVEPRSS